MSLFLNAEYASADSWITGSWSACSAATAPPSYRYGDWGSCSASCGDGIQSRSQTCPAEAGSQRRSVKCRTGEGKFVPDSHCDVKTKPSDLQTCSRGAGSECANSKPMTRACNTHACGSCSLSYSFSGSGGSCLTDTSYDGFAYAKNKENMESNKDCLRWCQTQNAGFCYFTDDGDFDNSGKAGKEFWQDNKKSRGACFAWPKGTKMIKQVCGGDGAWPNGWFYTCP